MKHSICFIGMPAVGKSTIGKKLAKKLGFVFLDGDDYIEEKQNKKLQDVLDRLGDEAFLRLEEKSLLEIPLHKTIFSPGGSVVYSEKVMHRLKKETLIVYLYLSYDLLKQRFDERPERYNTRGIVYGKIKTLQQLYNERANLYDKWAELKIDCGANGDDKVVEKILEEWRKFS